MKKGDKVISKGDQWVGQGSEGIVKIYKSPKSVFITWYKIKKSIYKAPLSLYHKEYNLILLKEGDIDPNQAFIRRK